MDDYYALVGVDRAASREVIDRAIRRQLRVWQRRAAAKDLVRRQEAERRVRRLGEARVVLLDDEKRVRYDGEFDAYWARPSSAALPPDSPASHSGEASTPSHRPAPPHRPAWWRQSKPTIEFAHPRAAQVAQSVLAGCALFLAPVAMTIVGEPALSLLLYLLLGLGFLVATDIRRKGRPRVALSPVGICVIGPDAQHIPWAMVFVIEETEVDGVARVGVRTVDGRRILLPAPRGRRLLTGEFDFAGKLVEMQRRHAYYGAPPSAVDPSRPDPGQPPGGH